MKVLWLCSYIFSRLTYKFIMISSSFTEGLMDSNSKAYNHNYHDNKYNNNNDNDFWAIIVSTSRYWFNYRHTANAVSVYKTMRDLGISDSNIIFMNAMDIISIDSRNNNPGYIMFNNKNNYDNDNFDDYLFSMNDIQVDYHNEDVNVQSFIQLLTGRRINHHHHHHNNILNSNQNSSILIYLTGHGGDEFFKFHDYEELSAQELGYIFQEMYIKDRYKEILLILDTCQAITMSNYITSPNIITLASSSKGENSYAYSTNDYLGVATSDRFTYSMYVTIHNYIKYYQQQQIYQSKFKHITLYDLYKSFNNHVLHSTVSIHQSINSTRGLKDIELFDFIHPHRITASDSIIINSNNVLSNSFPNHEFINALWMESTLIE